MRTIAFLFLVAVVPAGAEDASEWPESAYTLRAATLRAAVVQWCDENDGSFVLQRGFPFCFVMGGERNWIFVGASNLPDDQYWWHLRSNDLEGAQYAVLWLTDPDAYSEPHTYSSMLSRGKEPIPPDVLLEMALNTECVLAQMATNNPARVPVVLVGSAADQC